ncbi:hypothetical protein G7Y31_01890 [Corynebacterium lizhenjunii]|uniref:Uncharacterized protein n=1 Tax=Corynebacterium lizhenjunii TaxID=2709394 RepID=A0A7T0PC99_9CORY|nr:hypothetical protein [Corynebacterium lizhenjunii]QPK79487.1 hypothetical protein G7Y31_01890 [Corynebacterium lizhenjunii]
MDNNTAAAGWGNFVTGSSGFAADLGRIADWFSPFTSIASAISKLIGLIN